MEILAEKFCQFLERRNSIGDIMPERRGTDKDNELQDAYERVWKNGTYFVKPDRIQSRLRAKELKFRWKKENIAGLQLCDLVAHPSHMIVRERLRHPVNLGTFCAKLKPILLNSKYDRSNGGSISGYGIKVAS